jgi:signal peptidase I
MNDRQPNKTRDLLIDGAKTVGLAALLTLGVRAFVAEARYVSSGSMLPTLEINDRLIVDKIGYHFHEPQRGDIVLFEPTEALKQRGFRDDILVKRLIGLPGERVEVKNGKVYVNQHVLEENYIAEMPHYRWGPVTVPPNSYLVLGDNRNDSLDSHVWGFVPRDRIIGRAIFRFYPLNRVGVPH